MRPSRGTLITAASLTLPLLLQVLAFKAVHGGNPIREDEPHGGRRFVAAADD